MMRLTVGKTYRQRNGRLVTLRVSGLNRQERKLGFRFIASDGTLYPEDGRFLKGQRGEEGRDIVDVVEPDIKPLFAHGADRKLRRGDVVELPLPGCFIPGRVWRRIDADHVQVIDAFSHVEIFRDDQLKLSDYKGTWKWLRHSGNEHGHTPRWSPMTSLRRLKKLARAYNDHFGGLSRFGEKVPKQDRLKALADREVWTPRLDVTHIVWDKEVDGEEQEVDLPDHFIFSKTVTEEEIADLLADRYGYCVRSFVATPQPIAFPGYKKA